MFSHPGTICRMEKGRRLTKAAARVFMDELARRAANERLAAKNLEGEERARAIGRAEGKADAALLLTATFDLHGAAIVEENGILAPHPACGYAFCRCASCGKPSCGKE